MPLVPRSSYPSGSGFVTPTHYVGGDFGGEGIGPTPFDRDEFFEGRGGPDNLEGGEGNDTLAGQRGDDTLDGGNGDDTLDGGLEKDTLVGMAGNDTLDGGNQNDVVAGGSGSDTAWGGYGADKLFASGHDFTTPGGHGRFDPNADSAADDLAPDLLYGGAGNDRLEVWAGDTAYGGAGADRFVVMGEVDTLEAALLIIKDFKSGTDVIEFG